MFRANNGSTVSLDRPFPRNHSRSSVTRRG